MPIEVRILLPWPLLAPHLLDRFFCQTTEHCNRLTNLLFSLCRVLSIDDVYTIVMEAISTITETLILGGEFTCSYSVKLYKSPSLISRALLATETTIFAFPEYSKSICCGHKGDRSACGIFEQAGKSCCSGVPETGSWNLHHRADLNDGWKCEWSISWPPGKGRNVI